MKTALPYQWNEPRLWRHVADQFRQSYKKEDWRIAPNGICRNLSLALRQPYDYSGRAFDLLNQYRNEFDLWDYTREYLLLRARLCEKIARRLKKELKLAQTSATLKP